LFTNFRQLDRGVIFTVLAILFIGVFMASVIGRAPLRHSLTLSAIIIIFIVAFANTEAALYILIFSMLLSPEIKVAEIPGREIVIRFEDLLLIIIFFAWLARMAINKELGLFTATPLNRPLVAYIAICLLSTSFGVLRGSVMPAKGFFFALRYLEYILLYFMVANNIRDKTQVKRFVFAFLLTCALVSLYATLHIGKIARVSAPFEGAHGEPNTLGGYLILLFALAMGLFLYSSGKTKFWTGALAVFILPPFLYTLSRTSFVAFIPMYLSLIILTKKKKVLLIILLLLGISLSYIILPAPIINRVTRTFTPGREYQVAGFRLTLDPSASARVESYRGISKKWINRPFLGYGITGVGLVDSQYPRILGELGIIGLGIFIWLLIAIFKRGLQIFRDLKDDYTQGLTLGFLAGFVGLLFHSFGANTFIILRIMEPFWFLAAIVVMLPEASLSSQK
jgi:hypothetical protein